MSKDTIVGYQICRLQNINGEDLWFGLYCIVPAFVLIIVGILCAVLSSPQTKKEYKKILTKSNRQKITLNDLSGNVQSIHPWGRTEVVPIKSIELEYFEYCDEWVMYGDIVQPDGRKDYFMPILKGRLNLDIKGEMIQTWIEYKNWDTGLEKDSKTYEDFRVANILVKNGNVINILYKHYRLDENKSWSIIAVWEAN